MPSRIIISVETNGERRELHTMDVPTVPPDVGVDPDSRLLAEKMASAAAAGASIIASGGQIISG